jgi:hypothetical protein
MCAKKVLKRIERIFKQCRINNVRLCRDDVNAGGQTGQPIATFLFFHPHRCRSISRHIYYRCPRPIDSFKLMAKLHETPFNWCPTCRITTHWWSPFGCFISIHLEMELMATRRQSIQVNDLLFHLNINWFKYVFKRCDAQRKRNGRRRQNCWRPTGPQRRPQIHG